MKTIPLIVHLLVNLCSVRHFYICLDQIKLSVFLAASDEQFPTKKKWNTFCNMQTSQPSLKSSSETWLYVLSSHNDYILDYDIVFLKNKDQWHLSDCTDEQTDFSPLLFRYKQVLFFFLVWFLFYSPSTHFRSFRARSVTLTTHCSMASLLGSLPVISAHSFATNWQPLLESAEQGEWP